MEFRKYQHVERFGTDEVDGINLGTCYVFPKIDGTNGSVWMVGDEIRAGSRNRELSLDNDNAGFYAYILEHQGIREYLKNNPAHRLFGEFLVKHTIKTYRDDAWRKFYVFDVCVDDGEEEFSYLTYDEYKPLLDEYGLDYLPPLAIVRNGNYDHFTALLEKNDFLIKDGCGTGEGIVIKNYDYFNRFKRQTWAKIVTSEFRENHYKAMGSPEIQGSMMTEERIVEDYCTPSFIEKEYAKIVTEKDGWRSQYIPMLLGRVFSELIKEESWNFVKKYKNPKVDFKTLNTLVINKIKSVKSDVFA